MIIIRAQEERCNESVLERVQIERPVFPVTIFPFFWFFSATMSLNEASPQQAAGYHKEGHCL
jgi:hypothetical protein